MKTLIDTAPWMLNGLLFAAVMFSVLWVIHLLRKDAGVVDIGWTAGVGIMAVAAAVAGDGWLPRRLLVAVLAGTWAFRLCAYILADRILRGDEDGRYRRMREYWGKRANLYFYFFFTSQSLLVVLFALPFFPLVNSPHAALRAWDIAGLALWAVAIAGETMADRQLARFRKRPQNVGKTCREGLWRYSRHPNYFFEWLHWWAYVLLGVGIVDGWLTLVGPILMFLFLMRLTGIPYTEKQALASRGDDYRDYQRTTSMFIPLPPEEADTVKVALDMAERGMLPDRLMESGIRRLLRSRLAQEKQAAVGDPSRALREFVDALQKNPIAVDTRRANEQHYELPPPFFQLMLGPRLKYSSCLWDRTDATLGQAEDAMLELTCRRAGIADGMRVLELGCGWGSLTLWMAEHFPKATIRAVSNSAPQRQHIQAECKRRGHGNVEVLTADMNTFAPDGRFDRVVSVEMFEHMRNWQELLRRVRSWLTDEGRLFVHIFCHRELAYLFEDEGDADWMARHFFSGGIMPSENLFAHFAQDLVVQKQWRVNGVHYDRTLRAWLRRLDGARDEVMPVLESVYGKDDARRWFHRWRIFLLACAVLFGYRSGEEWFVGHYLLAPTTDQPREAR